MATMTDTLIFELKVDDQASKVFDAWDKRLKDMGKTMNKSIGGGGMFSGMLTAGKKAFDSLLGIATSAINAIFDSFKKLGGLTIDIFKDTVADAMSFEDAMIVARRTMGLTAKETDVLGAAMLDLSTRIGGIEADTLAEIAGTAGTLGIRGVQNVTDFSEAIAKIAISTDIAAGQAAEKIPKILTIYKTATEDMGAATKDFGNMLNILGNNMNATQGQILMVAQSIAGTASTVGLTKDQMLAISAAIATVETRMGTAGSSFAQVMSKMSSNYTKFAEVLSLDSEKLKTMIETNPVEALRMVVDRLREIGDTQGVVAAQQALDDLGFSGVKTGEFMKKMTATFGQVDVALGLLADQKKVNNSLDAETEIAMGTLTKQWEAFNNIINNAQKLIGGPIKDALSIILKEYVNPLITQFYEWIKSSEMLNELLPRMLSNARILFKDLLDAAVGFVQGIDWDSFFTKIHDGFLGVTEFIQNVDWGKTFETLKTTVEAVFNFITNTLPSLLSSWESFTVALENTMSILGILKDAWNVFSGVVGKVFDLAHPGFDLMIGALDSIKQALDGDITGAIRNFAAVWIDVVGRVKDSLLGLFEGPQKAMDAFFDGVVAKGEKAINAMADLGHKIKNMIPGIKEADKEMTGNSLLPDTVTWGQKATGTMSGLNNKISDMATLTRTASNAMQTNASALSALGAAGQNFTGTMTGAGGRITTTARKSGWDSDLRERAGKTTTSSPGGFKTQTGGTTINFNGQNVIDDSSQRRFVKKVTDVQRKSASRVVGVGRSSGGPSSR